MRKKTGIFLLVFFGVLCLNAKTFAQAVPNVNPSAVSDKQLIEYYRAAQAKGLTDSQIESLALANGYSREDIAKVRERLERLSSISAKNTSDSLGLKKRQQTGDLSRKNFQDLPGDSLLAKRDSSGKELMVKKKKQTFGANLFAHDKLSFEPNLRIPTPPSYVIGSDDQLLVDISGYAYQHYALDVSPEGTIKIENLAPIYVNGLTVQQAKTKIDQRLRSIFAGLRNGSLTLDVTLGNVRSIRVTVVGETEKPGTFTVSSLASVFHALYLSGGPSDIGSYRNIQIIRNNRIVQRIDLYDFLLNGISPGNIGLQDQDVILIPLAERKVEFEGEVKRPLFFELKAGESLKQVLAYAGGFTDKAYSANLNITRKKEKEKQLVTIDQTQFSDYAIQDGDLVTVGKILDRYENKVEISGAVLRPGEYAISDQMKTVKQLILKAEGLREDAFTNRAVLKRQRDNLDPEFLSVDLKALLKGEAPDVELHKEDELIVRSIAEVRESRNVKISGAVSDPGEYNFFENMTVGDLVLLAGGFREGATDKRVEIARRLFNDESNGKTVEMLNVVISKDLKISEAGTTLKPFDQVFVRDLPNYQVQKLVSISGEVNYPGKYAIESRNEKIFDLIIRSGGVRPEADIRGAKFYRKNKLVAVDLVQAVIDPKSINNLTLEDKDSLVIPKEQQTVIVAGEVLNPTSVAYQPNFSFKDYISQAGGFTDSAYVKKTYVTYANGLTDRTKNFLGIRVYPKVERGMQVYVPVKRKERMSKAEIISISTGMVSLSAVLLTLFRVL